MPKPATAQSPDNRALLLSELTFQFENVLDDLDFDFPYHQKAAAASAAAKAVLEYLQSASREKP